MILVAVSLEILFLWRYYCQALWDEPLLKDASEAPGST